MGYVQKRGRIAGKHRYEQIIIFVLISLLWHLFWISSIKIVSNPDNGRPVKFSKVSFLGPLLARGAELQARPRESSFLEKRYFASTVSLPDAAEGSGKSFTDGYDREDDVYHMKDDKMTALIDEALSGPKIEPSYEEE